MSAQTREYVGNRSLATVERWESDVNMAIGKKDFERISKNFDETVEISFPSKEGSFSKIQAKFVLKEFFTDYPCTSFEHSYAGLISSRQSRYTIGDYKTDKGDFEVKINYKNKQGIWLINRIAIVQK